MDGPREVDIQMFSCPEQLLESVEDLQYKVEELQVFCEERETQKQELQQRLIDTEKEFAKRIKKLNQELSTVRQTKVHIARENIMKQCAVAPRWFNALTTSVEQERTIADLTIKVDELTLDIIEKQKKISSLEHQLKNSDATIVVLTSDRNRMAVEVDELALRLEEIEYGGNFHKDKSDRCHAETASFNSYEDEAMSCIDKQSSANSRTSYQSEEDSDGFAPLKRSSNFSNINALDESAVLEQATATAKMDVASPVSNTPLKTVVKTDKNDNLVENPDHLDKDDSIVDQQIESVPKSSVYEKSDKENESRNDLFVRHKDTSWERFDHSENGAKFPNASKLGLSPFYVNEAHSNAFENEEIRSPFSNIIESTPVSKSDRTNDGTTDSNCQTAQSGAVADPWISPALSPALSPAVERNKKALSRNLFWEKNSDCNIYPFYIPESNEADDCTDESSDLNISLPDKSFNGFDEAFKDNSDVVSPGSIPINFSFDEKMMSSDEVNQKPAKVFMKKASKENLWDFEPDSIVDVSTGQTIYESLKKDDDCQTSKKEPPSNSNDKATEDSNDLSCLKKYLPLDEHARSASDLTSEMSKEKAMSSFERGPERRPSPILDGHQHEREFVKKGSRREREALQAYFQWKVKGKQGVPPANFKITLC